jgi:hypothetical protein
VWEEISALATLFTGVAIVLTVLLGIRQLRLTADQLDHLRRATQLEGAMKIFDDFNTAEFRESFFFIMSELPKRMEEPGFRADVALVGMADDTVHKELHLMRTFERVGTYVKNGLIEGAIIYDYFLPPIVRSWDALAEVVRIHRTTHGEAFWENFELLYRESLRARSFSPELLVKRDDQGVE